MNKKIGVYATSPTTKKYIYQNDCDTYEHVKELFKKIDDNHGFFTSYGIEYLIEKYTEIELDKITVTTHQHKHLDTLITHDTLTNVEIMSKEEYLENLSGNLDECLKTNSILISYNAPFDFSLEDITTFISKLSKREHINQRVYKNLLDYIFLMTDINPKLELYFYQKNFLVSYLIAAKEDYIENAKFCVEHFFNDIIYNEGKPLEEQHIPDEQLIRILHLYRDEMLEGDYDLHKHNFLFALNKLCDEGNFEGLEYKAFTYYYGNEFVDIDYDISEETFVKLCEVNFDPEYASVLGNIYRQGLVNNNIAQYDKALKYYNMGLITGDIESIYRLGDMYLNGQGVEQNEDLAFAAYEQASLLAKKEFKIRPAYSSFAQTCLRMAKAFALKNDPIKDLFASYYYLEGIKACDLLDEPNEELRNELVSEFTDFCEFRYSLLIEYESLFSMLVNFNKKENCVRIKEHSVIFENDEFFLVPILEGKTCLYTDHLELIFKESFGYVNPIYNYDNMVFQNGYYIIYQYGMEIFRFKADYKIKIENSDQLDLTNKNDDYNYCIAICKLDPNKSETEAFLAKFDEAEDENLHANWEVMETGQKVYPVEFKSVAGNELPSLKFEMQHIRIKRIN